MHALAYAPTALWPGGINVGFRHYHCTLQYHVTQQVLKEICTILASYYYEYIVCNHMYTTHTVPGWAMQHGWHMFSTC